MTNDEVNSRVQSYIGPYGPSGTSRSYTSANDSLYLEDRVRWLEIELVRMGQTVEALCAVFQRVGVGK
jgi:hypothetical protein